jgi:conjugative transfer signal peptidase TraF
MPDRPGLPLFEWDPPLARSRHARRRPILAAMGIGLALLGLAVAWHPAPRLVWNASASAAIGLWGIHVDGPVHVGDMVLVNTPSSIRQLAATRHYLPANVPLLKRVVAANGDVVCAAGPAIFVNSHRIARRLVRDRLGRPLPRWSGCETLRDGRFFLLMDAPDSFDGRYFGPVAPAAIIGTATPLWLR